MHTHTHTKKKKTLCVPAYSTGKAREGVAAVFGAATTTTAGQSVRCRKSTHLLMDVHSRSTTVPEPSEAGCQPSTETRQAQCPGLSRAKLQAGELTVIFRSFRLVALEQRPEKSARKLLPLSGRDR